MNCWYVAQVEPTRERAARDALMEAGFEAFLPLERKLGWDKRHRKPIVVDRPLFAGYVLVRLDLDRAGWSEARQARGILHLLPIGRERPLPLRTGVVEHLIEKDIERAQLTLDDLLGHNRRKRKPRFPEGSRVEAQLVEGEYELTYDAIVKADMGDRVRLLIGALEVVVPAGKVRAA